MTVGGPSLKATLRFGAPSESGLEGAVSVGNTLAGLAPATAAPVELDETIDASPAGATPPAPGPAETRAGRTTVLPRRRAVGVAPAELRPRFDRVRLLGEGGMGQV